MPLVQTFLRYRRRVRVGDLGLIPISSEVYPQLTAWPPNLMHDSDTYQSLIPYLEAQNADGYVFALNGDRLTAALAVSSGHKHDTSKTYLTWWPMGNWQLPANRAPNIEACSLTTNINYNPKIAVLLETLPPGAALVAIRGCVSGPSGGGATFFFLKVTFFGDLDTTFAAGITHYLLWDLSDARSYNQAWMESIAIDLSGLSMSADRQVVCVWEYGFDVAAGAPNMVVHQVQTGVVG